MVASFSHSIGWIGQNTFDDDRSSSSSSSDHASHRRSTRSGVDVIVIVDDKDITDRGSVAEAGSITESGDAGRGDNVGKRRKAGWYSEECDCGLCVEDVIVFACDQSGCVIYVLWILVSLEVVGGCFSLDYFWRF